MCVCECVKERESERVYERKSAAASMISPACSRARGIDTGERVFVCVCVCVCERVCV